MTSMGKAGAFSTLAETAEEFIKLECARRRNQVSLKRKTSLPEQFHVSGHKSRLKEKLAQARRHTFLLRADNKAALVAIIDNVRDLANSGREGNTSMHISGLSPLESDRFLAWASDAEKLLFEFEPSENHADDPLLRVLEHLQFLQDGHVCLAEVTMDARVLLERWDRSGVFDSESSDEDEDEDNNHGDHPSSNHGFLVPDVAKEKQRHLEHSYAYQNVRQRAAAGLIKRNVLAWVRSKPSFCERVAEIEVFGRTTEGLLKELSLTSAVLAGAKANGGTDIFALATGRRDPKSMYSSCIAFKDLLQFSKHMALFPVDQALRTVEDATRRRFLFSTRCAMKIQLVWRRVREIVRARRLHRAMEELRLQREQEAQTKREAAKEAKKRKPSEAGKKKMAKAVLKRSSTARAIANSKPPAPVNEISKGSTMESSPESEMDNARRKHSSALPPDGANRPSGSVTSSLDDKPKPPTSTPRSRQRPSRGTTANNNDSDDDTTDVEAAWKSFMDTVAADVAAQEVTSGADVDKLQEAEPTDVVPPVTLPPMEDNWETWSDNEAEVDNNEDLGARDKVTSRLPSAASSTPSTPAPVPHIKVVVSVTKSSSSENASATPAPARHLPRRETTVAKQIQNQPPTTPSAPDVRPLSSLPFDATLQNHTGPYTGAGQLSLMAPFIDADRRKKSTPNGPPERKHLYELDFASVNRKDASIVHLADAFVALDEPEVPEVPLQQKISEKREGTTVAVDTPRVSARFTTVARLRNVTREQEQSARNSIDANAVQTNSAKDRLASAAQTSTTRDRLVKADEFGRPPSAGGDNPTRQAANKPDYFVYGTHGVNLTREVILRKGTMTNSPLAGSPGDNSTETAQPSDREMKAWHRSTVVAPQGLATPHPPANRFHTSHKKRPQGPGRQVIESEPTGFQVEPVTVTKQLVKKEGTRSELPLLLRRSRAVARRRQRERSDVPDDPEEQSDTPAPDTNKQMWKRGGELPALALAQIRDRVGYRRKSSNQKRMSIVAELASALADVKSEDASSVASVDEQPGGVPDDEEGGKGDETSDGDDDGRADSDDGNTGVEAESESPVPESNSHDLDNPHEGDSVRRKESQEVSEEFRRLHLASRERELTRRRSLLSQLQSEEDAAVETHRRQSKDVSHDHKLVKRRQSRRLSAHQPQESRTSSDDAAAPSSSSPLHSSDDDSEPRRRRRMRVETRDADPYAESSEEDGDNADTSFSDVDTERAPGMTQAERDAAFQKLLTQYLGLLQCAPAEAARRLQVSSNNSN